MKVLFILILCLALRQGENLPDRLIVQIIGGQKTQIGKAPFQAALFRNGNFFCGGSIISADWILTAAHCVEGDIPSRLSVRVGSALLAKNGDLHSVESIFVHEDYRKRADYDYDIALVKVQTPIILVKGVKEIVKLSDAAIAPGTRASISGWGVFRLGGPEKEFSPQLLRALVTTIDQPTCRKMYQGVEKISPTLVCAGEPGVDSCQGDSGGPLVSLADGSQIGIVSFGKGCGDPKFYGVYTRVDVLRDWIEQNSES